MVPALQADYSMRPEDVFEATCRVAFCSPYLSNHYDRVQFGKALREALAVPFTDRRLDELARQVVGLPVRNRARGHRRHDNGGVGRGRGRGSGARQYSLKQQQKIYRIQRQQQEQKQDKQQNPKPRQWMPSRRDSTTSLSAASASLSKRQATASRSRVRDRAVKRTERTERYLLRGPSLGEKEFGMSGLNLSDEMAER
ncbi:hypothetical protein BD289DRAFT_439505 [Coniella lustricola]|uniref:Uncharacterized protein n=1 Tax=Coniella lustricola TaxID=2025994 RepID=A0A2T3A1H1_9PEZI|nr:hypothetical protein BD289DRAFT_439505 [Coniella lustricola]